MLTVYIIFSQETDPEGAENIDVQIDQPESNKDTSSQVNSFEHYLLL